MTRAAGTNGIAVGVGASVVLHVAIVAALLLSRPAAPPPMPPTFRVKLTAAPAGPRQIGVVQPQPATPPPVETPVVTPPRAERKTTPTPTTRPQPRRPAPQQATNVPRTDATVPKTTTPAPTAGGGSVGGRGSDLVNVNIGGIDFPSEGYLRNIINQIAATFSWTGAPLTADVSFVIDRDGSIRDIKLVNRSGSYRFDQAAMGAVEAVGKRFGPLPAAYTDDALFVIFRFDPKVIR